MYMEPSTYSAKGRLDVNAMLRQYSPLVRRLAHQMMAKLPANVEVDDLIQVGMIGLADALSRFDPAQGVQIETFATQRIRGAMLDELRGTQLIYLEDMSGDEGDQDFLDRHVADRGSDPQHLLQDDRMRHALVEAIKKLPEREQLVMSLYYEEDMNLKEIAAVLGVTESRVCQLHSQSIARLRVKLREW